MVSNGYDYHSSKEQIAHDDNRTRYLAKLGWLTIPVSGTEIYHHVYQCVQDIKKILDMLNSTVNNVCKPHKSLPTKYMFENPIIPSIIEDNLNSK